MKNTTRGKRPLVADKRSGATSAKKPTTPRKRPVKRRKPKPPRRGGIIGFFLMILRFFVRLFWAVTWRGTLAVVVVIGLWVG